MDADGDELARRILRDAAREEGLRSEGHGAVSVREVRERRRV